MNYLRRIFVRGFLAPVIALITLSPDSASAQPITIKWTSSDTSSVTVVLGRGAEFEWVNPNGSRIRLTGGLDGALFQLSDHKNKVGDIFVDPGQVASAANPNYGKNGEPAILASGQTLSGSGEFDLTLRGFQEISDVTTTFTASLVSNGTDNPLSFSIFGQGDQLAFPTPGNLDYITKWTSSDTIALSNGELLQIGNFLLSSLGSPTEFGYSLDLDSVVPPAGTFDSTFTIGEQYQFVKDFSTSPSGDNLRFALQGTVTKQMHGTIPEPATLALMTVGLAGIMARRKAGK